MPIQPSALIKLATGFLFVQALGAMASPVIADRAAVVGPDANFLRGVVATPLDAMGGKIRLVNVDLTLKGSQDFRRDGDGYAYTIDPARVKLEQQAVNEGVSIIHQVSGTPAAFPMDTHFRAYGADEHWGLPEAGAPMQDWQRMFVQWAKAWDLSVGGANYHSLWIGTQEPTHTLGAAVKGAGNDPSEEVQDINIARFIDFWKPIAHSLRASGAKVGGIQLPSGSQRRYQYAVDLLKQKDVELDYVTFQLYTLGESKALAAAVNAVKSYREKYPNAKLLIDRGLWFKTMVRERGGALKSQRSGHDTSEAMTWFLRAEKQIQEYSDYIAGYCVGKPGVGSNMTWSVLRWLDAAPHGRRTLSGLPVGIDGFYLADESRNSIALWNEGSEAQEIAIAVRNAGLAPESKLKVLLGDGREMIDISSRIHWEGTTISPLKLGTHQFVLLTF